MTAEPAEIEYPALLDLPAPRVKAYPCEAVIAEKFQALVAFDIDHSDSAVAGALQFAAYERCIHERRSCAATSG